MLLERDPPPPGIEQGTGQGILLGVFHFAKKKPGLPKKKMQNEGGETMKTMFV